MDIEFILNDALNKALITDRIKGVPSSNKIADFVSKYVESEQLILPVVIQQSELLMQSCSVCGTTKHPVMGAHCKANNCPHEH